MTRKEVENGAEEEEGLRFRVLERKEKKRQAMNLNEKHPSSMLYIGDVDQTAYVIWEKKS